MKIFYAVQATGNGHLSRAIQLLPCLQKFGEVDIFLSGSNSTLPVSLPIKYRSQGISLFNNNKGGLDYFKILKHNSWLKACLEARDLPVENYDVVINDFEPITARACMLKNKKSIQFSHQASFRSPLTPRPHQTNLLGEWIFRSYSTSSSYIGLHFKSYDDFILPPVIKKSLLENDPTDLGHITVYLFGFDRTFFERQLHPLNDLHFECFIPGISTVIKSSNITFYPIHDVLFTQSLLTCHGIITGGGFETPAEAMYLNKPLLCIPCKNHYEQYCNAAALQSMGIKVILPNEMHRFGEVILSWASQSPPCVRLVPNDIKETVQFILDTYSAMSPLESNSDSMTPLNWPLEANF